MNELTETPTPEFSRKVVVADLNAAAGRNSNAKATAEERAALAERFDAIAVPRFSFAANILPWRDGWRVVGVARARLTRSCVVTLEPVDEIVEERFERCFTAKPDVAAKEEDIDPEAEDPPELLGETIDVGEIAAETVTLALDPYPRAADVEFEGKLVAPKGAEPLTDEAVRPFAGLEELRRKLTPE